MRILLTGDSHVKDMFGYLQNMAPQHNYFQVWRSGARLSDIETMISAQISQIQQYNPDVIIYHIGHNSINKNDVKNPTPKWGKNIVQELLALIIALKGYFPTSRHVISCMYPRVPSRYLSDDEARSFNQTAFKLSRYADTIVRRAFVAKLYGLEFCFVPDLWTSVYGRLANPIYFDRGGLHLLPDGKRIVCRKWLSIASRLMHWYP